MNLNKMLYMKLGKVRIVNYLKSFFHLFALNINVINVEIC